MNTIKQCYYSICNNIHAIFLACMWVIFMVFFTYTDLVYELFLDNGDFCNLFYKTQCEYVSLFVNVGIVIMLLFDNHVSNDKLHGVAYYLPIVAIVLCLFINAHCSLHIENELTKFVKPISWECLSIITHIIFLGLVFILKARSLWKYVTPNKELK